MKKKKITFEVRIRLRSFNTSKLGIWKDRLKTFAVNNNLLYSSINLPIKKKKINVLKSPHVNKKAREEFEIVISNCLIILKGLNFDLPLYRMLSKIESEEVLCKLVIS